MQLKCKPVSSVAVFKFRNREDVFPLTFDSVEVGAVLFVLFQICSTRSNEDALMLLVHTFFDLLLGIRYDVKVRSGNCPVHKRESHESRPQRHPCCRCCFWKTAASFVDIDYR